MAHEIKMPQLSDTMYSGKIVTWLKREGDSVNRGDALAEVETDKANLQIESFQRGVLLKIITPALSTANVGDVIAYVGVAGEQVAASNGSSSSSSTNSTPPPTPLAAAIESPSQPISSSTQPAAVPTPAENPKVGAPTSDAHEAESGRVKASPFARKLAEQRNIDITTLTGSGPSGRIIRKDIEAARSGAAATTMPAESKAARTPAAHLAEGAPSARVGGLTPLSKMRETIARRMVESVTTAPHFYVTTTISMDEAVRLRELLKEREEYKGISLNHLVIKAAAYALSHEPKVNCAMRDGQLFNPGQINIGIITAIGDGLLIPVIKDADALTLKDLVFEARAAVERARAGRPSSTDLLGGTFSISNMGMFDVDNFTAIINPGQGGILAVGSTKEEAVVRKGNIVIGKTMKVTLSVDHRIIDGVMAGTFLKFFKEALETPALLTLG